jgi:hypothetical protein
MNKHTIIIAFSIFCFGMTIFSIIEDKKEKVFCGTVKYKIDATSFSKHKAESDPILVVNFGPRGIVEINPNWNDYMEAKVGSNVCFSLKEHPGNTYWFWGGLLFFVATVLCVFVGLVNILE